MLNIRAIEQKDLEKVFNHAYQLAIHTGSLSDFVLTKELLQSELFNNKADWYGLVVTKNNEIVGSCLYSFANNNRAFNSTNCLFLDILFVEPKYRHLGIGRMLIKNLEKISQEKGVKRIEFWCMKDNTASIEFYKKMGAQKIDLLDVYNIVLADNIANQ